MAACVPVSDLPVTPLTHKPPPPFCSAVWLSSGSCEHPAQVPGLVLSLMCICLPGGWLGATHHHSPLCGPKLASLGVAASAPACAGAAAPRVAPQGTPCPISPPGASPCHQKGGGCAPSTSHSIEHIRACTIAHLCCYVMGFWPTHTDCCVMGLWPTHKDCALRSTPPCLCDGFPVHTHRFLCDGHLAHTHTGAVCWASGPHTQMTLPGLPLSAPICHQMGLGVATLSPPGCPCGPLCGLHSG